MSAPQKIIDLVEDFKENKHEYKNADVFDEENTKIKFLNPFFEELGWNVRNEGLSARFREVVFEDSIKVGKKTKAPDYSFRLGGERIFFVEAKKPSRDIANDKEHAFQVRRYGWSAGLPLCILTDFEELAIYDTTIKPEKNQSASIGRVKYYKYTDYIKKWDEIYDIFSKDAVLSGKFDNYANNIKHDKKGTSQIDDEFLKEIEQWRLLLARNIALRNEELSIEDLNYAVQLTIDRIIFLRIAEDRGIERYGRLYDLLVKPNIYKNFTKLCKEADQKYNSGLFHFNQYDKEDFTTDTYTLNLTIDDKVFKEIFNNLYYPNSPYEFSLITTEILGKIYEQFLGKVIRLTPSHKAKVEYKPEVKKAGGIYYTPQYVVDYIVENTLGKKIKNKTPNQISKLKVIDPACGSGSFLIRAYQYLLDYHVDYYSKLEKPPKNTIYTGKDGIIRLTIREKKRILKNNIYGVDVDSLAIEVTKLSLLLKVLEDQNKDQLESQQKLYHERALPNLSSNIKNGNSLIKSDILNMINLNHEELLKINPFEWEEEFPEIFENGGFDVVIGNPPYVKIHNMNKLELEYYFNKYYSAEKKCDLYSFFVEKSLNQLLKTNGYLGFIISNTWLNLDSFTNLREIISKQNVLKNITIIKNPFKNVSVTPVIFFVEKNRLKNYKIEISKFEENTIKHEHFIDSNTISKENKYIIDINATPEALKLLNKINDNSIKLIDLSELYYGIMTANNKKFVISEKNKEYHKPLLRGKDIKRYHIENKDIFIDYRPEEMKKKKTARPGSKERFEINEKIIFQRYSSSQIIASIDRNEFYTLGTTIVCVSKSDYSNTFLLGLINSKLINWWYGRVFTSPTNYIREFESIPIINIDFNNPEDINYYNSISEAVEDMLLLNEQLYKCKSPKEDKIIRMQIKQTDEKINHFVYKLYKLSENEIHIIETKTE